jgi:hypothetical protein
MVWLQSVDYWALALIIHEMITGAQCDINLYSGDLLKQIDGLKVSAFLHGI